MAENAGTDGGMAGDGPGGSDRDTGDRGFGSRSDNTAQQGFRASEITAQNAFGRTRGNSAENTPQQNLRAAEIAAQNAAFAGVAAAVASGRMSARQAAAMGYGDLQGVNPNNPTQSLNEMANAQGLHNFLNKNIGSLAGMVAGPAVGAAVGAAARLGQGQSLADVLGGMAVDAAAAGLSKATGLGISGQALQSALDGNMGQAAIGAALGTVAKDLGVPAKALESALQGNLGQAVANSVSSALVGAAAKEIGLSPAVTGLVGNVTGVTSGLRGAISSGVNSSLGPVNDALRDFGSGLQGFAGGSSARGTSGTGGWGVGDVGGDAAGRADRGDGFDSFFDRAQTPSPSPAGGLQVRGREGDISSNLPSGWASLLGAEAPAPAPTVSPTPTQTTTAPPVAAAPTTPTAPHIADFLATVQATQPAPQMQTTAWVAPQAQQQPFSFTTDYNGLVKMLR